MKQHITIEQLNELSEKGRERLREWWKPQEADYVYHVAHEDCWASEMLLGTEPYPYSDEHCLQFHVLGNNKEQEEYLPLLSIGQMIEFLDENGHDFNIDFIGRDVRLSNKKGGWGVFSDNDGESIYVDSHRTKEELCDALWEAVKEILER